MQQPQQMGASFGGYGRTESQSTVYTELEVQQQQQSTSSQPNVLIPTPVKPQAMYDPGLGQQSVQSLGYPNEAAYQPPPQSSGWNDPPIAKGSSTQVNFSPGSSFLDASFEYYKSIATSRPTSFPPMIVNFFEIIASLS
jgi:hypothetical protein